MLSLLDSHQDLYNEVFQGEGAPLWAVKDGGLPNPQLGFPGNYFANPAENFAWNSFWRNAPAPDGIGLQDHYAAMWAHVAGYFRRNPGVFGYEILNEPWPVVWPPCANPVTGCILNDAQLRSFYNRVLPAIRNSDSTTLVFFEPNLLFDESIHTDLGTVSDANTVFSFHDYCAVESELHKDITCSQQDQATFNNALRYTTLRGIPALLTEFGATNDLANLTGVLQRADADRIGWLEWAYTGNDKTSSSPTEQALVFDPALPPVGSNVNQPKLAVLGRALPAGGGGHAGVVVVQVGHLPAVLLAPAGRRPGQLLPRRADAGLGASRRVSERLSRHGYRRAGGLAAQRARVDRGGRRWRGERRRRRDSVTAFLPLFATSVTPA